jgi:hypothetical protein
MIKALNVFAKYSKIISRSLTASNLCFQFTLKGIQALTKNCPSLEILDLSECKEVNDECVREITSSLPRLKTLKLNRCEKITEKCLQILYDNCSELRVSLLVLSVSINDVMLNSISFQNIFLRNCRLRFDPADHLMYMSSLRKVVVT